MTYSRKNMVEERQEAGQKVREITEFCAQLSITLDPIDWDQYGMRAPVSVHGIEIASLMDLRHSDKDDILQRVRIKLFEHAALAAVHAPPGLKALIWSPIEVIQPQDFLGLWVITLETDERIPIVESIRDGQRVYELYKLDTTDEQQLARLFGPASKGEYRPGETVTIKVRDRQYTGEVCYVLPPGKAPTSRKTTGRGYHSVGGTTYTNDIAARYIVDCNDGFPHIVHQSQVTR